METKSLPPQADPPQAGKKTPLCNKHLESKAKMIEFGDWIMPVEYSGIIAEHKAVRNSAGLFDLTHMGELRVTGPDSLKLVQKLITNDASTLAENQVLYTVVCKEDGGILDDILVYRLSATDGRDEFFLVVNAGNTDKMYNWFSKWSKDFDVKVQNISDEIVLLAIQGPNAEKIVQRLVDADLSKIKYYNCIISKIGGTQCLISRTGYTGEDGFEIYIEPSKSEWLWDKILQTGESENIIPIGLGARDTLRLESKYCLYGHEITEGLNPLEAGLSWVVKFNKTDFIGKSALQNFKKAKTLIGFEMIDRGIPRQNYEIFKDSKKIGQITSGTYSPSLNKSIGLGYVPLEYKDIGTIIEVKIRDKFCKAQVTKTPFYKGGIKKS